MPGWKVYVHEIRQILIRHSTGGRSCMQSDVNVWCDNSSRLRRSGIPDELLGGKGRGGEVKRDRGYQLLFQTIASLLSSPVICHLPHLAAYRRIGINAVSSDQWQLDTMEAKSARTRCVGLIGLLPLSDRKSSSRGAVDQRTGIGSCGCFSEAMAESC